MKDLVDRLITQIREGIIEVNSYIEDSGQCASHIAAGLNYFDELKEIIELGSDLSKKNDSGDDVLHVALNAEYIDIVIFLLERGADEKSIDDFGKSVIDKVLEIGNPELSRFFVSHCKANDIKIDFKEPLRSINKRVMEEEGEEVVFQLQKKNRGESLDCLIY